MEELLIPIFGIIFVFGAPVAIVALAMRAYSRKRALMHETLNKMIDSGQPVAAELIAAFDASKPSNHLDKGIILLCAALGLAFFLWVFFDSQFASIAAIPGFLGLAFLILHTLDKRPGPATHG